ncbi:MAG: site-specific integrase [Gammaproteobacteria bacterium]
MLLTVTDSASAVVVPVCRAHSGSDWIALFTQGAARDRRVSANTLDAYARDLASLSRWAADQERDLLEFATADLARYVLDRTAQGRQPSTLARHLSTFRRFYAFLVSRGVMAVNPGATVVAPQDRRLASGLVQDEVLRSVLRPTGRQFVSPAAAYRAERDRTMVWMLYSTRLGISDVRLLTWGQVDEHRAIVRAPLRTGAVRSYGLDTTLLAALRTLRQAGDRAGFVPGDRAYCFATASGLPMTRQALCHLVRKWATDCGQAEPVTPSALRHTGEVHHAGRGRIQATPPGV